MLKRLFVGLVIGAIVGALVAAGAIAGLGWVTMPMLARSSRTRSRGRPARSPGSSPESPSGRAAARSKPG